MATSTPLYKTMTNDGNAVYYDETFRNVLEYHLEMFKVDRFHTKMNVEDHIAYKFEHDFYGLLAQLGVPVQHHWLTMRLNGMRTPTDYRSDLVVVLVPDFNEVDRIRSTHTTIHKIK